MIDRAAEHLGTERAARYLRKFYPWYLERLGGDTALQDALQRAETLTTPASCWAWFPSSRASASRL